MARRFFVSAPRRDRVDGGHRNGGLRMGAPQPLYATFASRRLGALVGPAESPDRHGLHANDLPEAGLGPVLGDDHGEWSRMFRWPAEVRINDSAMRNMVNRDIANQLIIAL